MLYFISILRGITLSTIETGQIREKMRHIILLGLFIGATASFGAESGNLPETKTVVDMPNVCISHYTSEKIKIDGILDEEVWAKIKPILISYRLESGKQPMKATYRTEVRTCWDKKNLYVSFVCEDEDIWATETQKDKPIFRENVCELFLDPSGQGKDYIEIEVNPLGAILDLVTPRPESVRYWTRWAKWDMKGLKTAVRINGTINNRQDKDSSWIVEMVLPFKSIPHIKRHPQVGDIWRVNFCRVTSSVFLDKQEICSWVPLSKPDFNLPLEYGILKFEKDSL